MPGGGKDPQRVTIRVHIRIGTQDLKIAAIVVEHGALLLSRNTIDFERVPGLQVESWLD